MDNITNVMSVVTTLAFLIFGYSIYYSCNHSQSTQCNILPGSEHVLETVGTVKVNRVFWNPTGTYVWYKKTNGDTYTYSIKKKVFCSRSTPAEH